MSENFITIKNNNPIIKFGGLKPRKYNVSIKYFDKENSLPTKRIDYNSQIVPTFKNDDWLLYLYKDNIWYNQHEPDLISEIIASELSEIIYPIQVKIDEKGTFLGITNSDTIINSRWHKNKSNLTKKYNTKVAQSFYEAFQRNIKGKNSFEKSMQYDWFWNLLFHPKHIDYGKQLCLDTYLYLAVIPYKYPIKFAGKQKINPEITEYNSVEIHFKSYEIEAPPYFIPENQNNLTDKFYMRLDVYFDLDIHCLFPMHTRAYFRVYSKDINRKELTTKRIEYTQYQEDVESNKITIPTENKSPFFAYKEDEDKIIKNKETKKKKGFWNFLD